MSTAFKNSVSRPLIAPSTDKENVYRQASSSRVRDEVPAAKREPNNNCVSNDQKREALKNETLGKLLLDGLRSAGLSTEAVRQSLETLKYRTDDYKPIDSKP